MASTHRLRTKSVKQEEKIADLKRNLNEAADALCFMADTVTNCVQDTCLMLDRYTDEIDRNIVSGSHGPRFAYFTPESAISITEYPLDPCATPSPKTEYGEFRSYGLKFDIFVPSRGDNVIPAVIWAHAAKMVAGVIETEMNKSDEQ